jgi:hypothetical protein
MPSLLCPRLSLIVVAFYLCAFAPPHVALADPLPGFDPPRPPGALGSLPAGPRIPFHPDGVLSDPGSPWPDPGRYHMNLWQRIRFVATALHEALAALEPGDGELFDDPPAENNTRRQAPLASELWDRHRTLRRQLLSASKPEAASDAPAPRHEVVPQAASDAPAPRHEVVPQAASDAPAPRHEVVPQATPPGPLADIQYSVDENGFYDAWPDDELPPVPPFLTIV